MSEDTHKKSHQQGCLNMTGIRLTTLGMLMYKDETNRHAKFHNSILENSLSQRRAHQLVQYQMVSPENIHNYLIFKDLLDLFTDVHVQSL